jgi:hypothetical protein
MSTCRVTIIAALSALAGVAIGAFGASWYWTDFYARFMTYGLVARTEADIVSRVSVLEHMRAGRTEHATNLLEVLLDGDLIGAGALARDRHEFSANTRRAVALERRARQASGYEPADPNVRTAVHEALHLLSPSSGEGSGQTDAPESTQETDIRR